jgi:endonuclease G
VTKKKNKKGVRACSQALVEKNSIAEVSLSPLGGSGRLLSEPATHHERKGGFMRLSTPPTFLALVLATVTLPRHALASNSQEYGEIEETAWTETVVGGSQVSPGQWPDAAGVFFAGELGCTGTLIAPNVVLTAGHCITADIDKVLLDSIDANAGGESIPVVQTIAYPNWEATYDLGLLILANESTVKPRTIAQGCALDRFYSEGAAVELVGYGATDTQGMQYTTKLLGGSATITDSACSPGGGTGCNAQVSPGGELIAGGNGVDSCFGDSGGPIYLRTEVGDYLIGATSRGLDNATTPCGGGGIYTRPDAVIAWIEEQAGVTLPVPTCQEGDDTGDVDDPNDDPNDIDPEDPNNPDDSDDAPGGFVDNGPITGGCSVQSGGSSGSLWLLALAFLTTIRRRSRLDKSSPIRCEVPRFPTL